MRVAIITSGYFPVPATKGGAVEALVDYLIKENELFKEMDLHIISTYDSKAVEISEGYSKSAFEFINVPVVINIADKIIYWIAKNILKKKKHMSYRYILQRLHFISKTSRILEKGNFDKVVLENHPTLFLTLKKHNNMIKYKDKYYYHLHNVVTNDYGCKDIMMNTKKIIGVSNYINNTFYNFLKSNINVNKFEVLNNCVDHEKFRIEFSEEDIRGLKEKYEIKEKDKIVLFTGRLNEEKGVRELLKAFKKIKFEDAKLMIVGSYYFASKMLSEYEIELKGLAKDLEDKIIFTGYVEYSEISKIYSLADVVVIPSIWDDPAPLTVIETLTKGKPLITTYSGGIPEYADTNSAIILDRDEKLVDNLAKEIDRLLSDEELRNKLSLAAINKSKEWTLENYYKNFVKLIKE